jgi:hypothetical protein
MGPCREDSSKISPARRPRRCSRGARARARRAARALGALPVGPDGPQGAGRERGRAGPVEHGAARVVGVGGLDQGRGRLAGAPQRRQDPAARLARHRRQAPAATARGERIEVVGLALGVAQPPAQLGHADGPRAEQGVADQASPWRARISLASRRVLSGVHRSPPAGSGERSWNRASAAPN